MPTPIKPIRLKPASEADVNTLKNKTGLTSFSDIVSYALHVTAMHKLIDHKTQVPQVMQDLAIANTQAEYPLTAIEADA